MKISSAYESVNLGVSQQIPRERLSGQHQEQVNLISDPVRGLTRRAGSVYCGHLKLDNCTDAMVQDLVNHRSFKFNIGDQEYVLLYRRGEKPAGSNALGLYCYHINDKKFLPVVTRGTKISALLDGGISACTAVGKYVYLAGNRTPVEYGEWDKHKANHTMWAWVRGGTYSRKFTIKAVMADGSTRIGTYTTMSSSYQGTLDTSWIAYNDPDYQKKVNDVTNQYNTAVNQHIAAAAESIQPERIAWELVVSLRNAGIPEQHVWNDGAYVVFHHDLNLQEVYAEDAGDNSYIWANGNAIKSVDQLSPRASAHKVIEIRPSKSSLRDAMYMEAIPKSESINFGDVTWRECAGVETQIHYLVSMLTIDNGTVYLASTPDDMKVLTPKDDVPPLVNSMVGDLNSCPQPYLLGEIITYLGVFQDRLIYGTGSVLLFSRTSDYLNIFRQTIADILDDDPIEVYATSASEDTITSSIMYDRNIIFFGERRQYVANGRAAFTPKTAAISMLAAYEGTSDCYPVESGNFAFYAQSFNGHTAVNQVQVGTLQDTPENFDISQQIDTYIQGRVLELVALSNPNMVICRSNNYENGVYVYSYLDNGSDGRIISSWSRWNWHPDLGTCVGLQRYRDDVLIFTVREANDGSKMVVCDWFDTNTDISDRPYLDSCSRVTTGNVQFKHTDASIVMGGKYPYYQFYGNEMTEEGQESLRAVVSDELYEADCWAGKNYDSYCILTAPYPRDSKNKAITFGMFVIQYLRVSIQNTGGLEAYITLPAKEPYLATRFQGSQLGRMSGIIGKESMSNDVVRIPIGREVNGYECILKSIAWQPLSIAGIEYVGNMLNNTRRM